MLGSFKLAFRCFQNASNSSMLLKWTFHAKSNGFYVFSSLILSEFALIWWTYIPGLLVYYDGTSGWPFPISRTRWNGNVKAYLTGSICILLFPRYRSHNKVHCIKYAAYSMQHTVWEYFTVTEYFLTASDFLTSLFKSEIFGEIFGEILTYLEIFTRNEFSSLNFMFRLDKS